MMLNIDGILERGMHGVEEVVENSVDGEARRKLWGM